MIYAASFVILLAPALHAAEPGPIDRGWYLAQSGRVEQAQQLAVERLHRDAGDLAAHRLQAWIMVNGLRAGAEAAALYRGWLEQEPDSAAARLGLAATLDFAHHEPGEHCEEVERLLDDPPTRPDERYWSLRVLYEARRRCPGERLPLREQLVQLGGEHAVARAYSLRLRVQHGPVNADLAADLATLYDEQPWRLHYPGSLWRMSEGEVLEPAREQALAAATRNLASSEPLAVESALRLFRFAGEPHGEALAEERLAVLDPEHGPHALRRSGGVAWIPRPDLPDRSLMWEIRGASSKANPISALAAALEFQDRVPAEGPVRAEYEDHLARLYDRRAQPGKALEALRRAWLADPADPERANGFAWQAALAEEHLEEALQAIEGALAAVPSYDPRGDHLSTDYDEWLRDLSSSAAAYSDTQGWLLYRLDRLEEAAEALRRAVLISPEPHDVFHLHLGLVYAQLGRPHEARLQLGRGLALADGDHRRLERQARRLLEPLYEDQRWAPEGLEGWIALQVPAAASEPGEEPPEVERGVYRLGRPFPDLALRQGEQELHISDFQGLRVVDLWATWCGPCVAALPHMDKVARRYASQGVTVIALSVDSSQEEMIAWFEGDLPSHLELAWAGHGALEAAKVTGIPSTFLLDEQGVVRGFSSGWGMGSRGDERASRSELEDKLDGMLEERGLAAPGPQEE